MQLRMIGQVAERRDESHADSFGKFYFFRDGQVQIPLGQTAKGSTATSATVQAKNVWPELVVHGLWIREQVHITGTANASGPSHTKVTRGATGILREQNGISWKVAGGTITLPQGFVAAVSVGLDKQRVAATDIEERGKRQSTQYAACKSTLPFEERKLIQRLEPIN